VFAPELESATKKLLNIVVLSLVQRARQGAKVFASFFK
jgi:hypothetical protein